MSRVYWNAAKDRAVTWNVNARAIRCAYGKYGVIGDPLCGGDVKLERCLGLSRQAVAVQEVVAAEEAPMQIGGGGVSVPSRGGPSVLRTQLLVYEYLSY